MRTILVANHPTPPAGLNNEDKKKFFRQNRMKIFREFGNYEDFKESVISECPDFNKGCIQTQYQKKIESFSGIEFVDDELPDYEFTKDVCSYAMNEVEKTKKTLTIIDINNDGAQDHETTVYAGTAQNPMVSFANEKNERLPINEVGYEWKTYGAAVLQNFIFKGKTFTLYSNEHSEPLFVSYVSQKNNSYPICEYSLRRSVEVDKTTVDKNGLCSARISGIGLERITFEKEEDPENIRSLISEEYKDPAFSSFSIESRGVIRTDLDNNGTKECIVSLAFASGAGRGCGEQYLRTMNENCISFKQGEGNIIQFDSKGLVCDGINVDLLEYKGTQYIEFYKFDYSEIDSRKNPPHLPQRIDLWQDGTIKSVCTFTQITKPYVSVIR